MEKFENDLDIIRAQFLSSDLDTEDREENEEILRQWEHDLRQNGAYLEWQENDITKQITAKVKAEYKSFGYILATNRNLTDSQRISLWAKQDACSFILSLTEKDAKGALEQIQSEIKRAISVT